MKINKKENITEKAIKGINITGYIVSLIGIAITIILTIIVIKRDSNSYSPINNYPVLLIIPIAVVSYILWLLIRILSTSKS